MSATRLVIQGSSLGGVCLLPRLATQGCSIHPEVVGKVISKLVSFPRFTDTAESGSAVSLTPQNQLQL